MASSVSNTAVPTARGGVVRSNRLAQAVGVALALCLMAPTVGANDAPATSPLDQADASSRERLAQVQGRLPDLGGDAEAGKTVLSAEKGEALLQRALGAVAAAQSTDSNGRSGIDPGRVTDEVMRQAANAGLNEGLKAARDSGLPFLGNLQGNLAYDNLTGKLDFGLVTIGSLLGDGSGHNLLGQLGAHNEMERPTVNAGLVYRWLNPDKTAFFGGNLFYDRDMDTGAQRLGVGAEAATGTVRAFANAYAPLSDDWFDSPVNEKLEERPASGFDAGMSYTPRAVPGLEVMFKGSRWKGDSVDVFGQGGKGERNPTVMSARVGYKPVPLVGFSVEHEKALGGQSDTRAMVNFSYQFGVPMADQLRASGNAMANDVSRRALAPVERENRIVMETREKVDPLLFQGGPLVSARIREDEVFEYLAAITGGALPIGLTLGGSDAGVFTLSGYHLALDAKGLPSDKDGRLAPSANGDFVYEVVLTATDGRGNRAEQRFQIEVIQVDTDEDGLSDRQEGSLGTDPNNPDTDGDGLTDGSEVSNGTDPLDPNDPGKPGGAGKVTAVSVYTGNQLLTGHPVVGQSLQATAVCESAGVAATCPTTLTFRWEVEATPGSGQYIEIAGAVNPTYTVTRDTQRRKLRAVALETP